MDCLLALSRLPGLFLEVMGTGIRLVCGVVLEPCERTSERGDREEDKWIASETALLCAEKVK